MILLKSPQSGGRGQTHSVHDVIMKLGSFEDAGPSEVCMGDEKELWYLCF